MLDENLDQENSKMNVYQEQISNNNDISAAKITTWSNLREIYAIWKRSCIDEIIGLAFKNLQQPKNKIDKME